MAERLFFAEGVVAASHASVGLKKDSVSVWRAPIRVVESAGMGVGDREGMAVEGVVSTHRTLATETENKLSRAVANK